MTLLVLVLGLLIGSFNNVVIYRLPRGESLVFPPSRCPTCGHRLRWWENVPLISFAILRGRCSACRSPISRRYPAVEALTAAAFLHAYLRHGVGWEGLSSAALASLLVPVVFIDLEHRIIPDRITLPGMALGLLLSFARAGTEGLKSAAYAALIAGGILWLVAVVSKGGMGGGDVKLAAMLGAFTDPARVLAGLFVGVVAGGMIGLALLVSGRKKRKDEIPFGPFLAPGGYVGAEWGHELVAWYLNVLS